MKIALRVRPDTGEIYVMERGESGCFEFGDPTFGDKKHHTKNVVAIGSLEGAVKAIAAGLHPRMRGLDTDQWNMISPRNVKVVVVPV